MEETPSLKLPYMVEGQANKEVYYNTVLKTLDAIIFLTVRNSYDTPPLNIVSGEKFLVGTNPYGAFAGHSKKIAQYIDSAWTFHTPQSGWVLYNETLDVFYKYKIGYNQWEKFIPKTFLELSDTPNSYIGHVGKYAIVNSGGNGIGFTEDIILTSENGGKFKLVISDGGVLGVTLA